MWVPIRSWELLEEGARTGNIGPPGPAQSEPAGNQTQGELGTEPELLEESLINPIYLEDLHQILDIPSPHRLTRVVPLHSGHECTALGADSNERVRR